MRVSRNVRALMSDRGVTQQQLGAAMQLSQAAISYRLTGRTPWDVVEVDQLAGIFGVEPASLLLPPPVLPRLDSNQQPADSRFAQVATEALVIPFRQAR